jgi:predicted tellurium resistance membrane protein TerC
MSLLFAHLGTLVMLVFLQAVLGFDNLLYISLESKRVAPELQKKVRMWGIGIAIAMRIVLLGVIYVAIGYFENPFFSPHWEGIFEAQVSGHALIVLLGGGFILYTAVKEILHMMSLEEENHLGEQTPRSAGQAIFWIVIMNLVFSFDSILAAIPLTHALEYDLLVMSIAILSSGVLMIVLAERVSTFLQKNRMYEVLGLFILFLVGVMLVSEGGHLAHVELIGHPVHAMSKSTFYFVLAVLIVVDVVQSRYQKKINLERKRTNDLLAQNH